MFSLRHRLWLRRPAASAFEQQADPAGPRRTRASWLSSVGFGAAIVGGPLAGLAIDQLWGIPTTFAIIASLFALAAFSTATIAPKPVPPPVEGETIWQSLRQGLSFVFHSQPLVGSMALDLFAVLFAARLRCCRSLPMIFYMWAQRGWGIRAPRAIRWACS